MAETFKGYLILNALSVPAKMINFTKRIVFVFTESWSHDQLLQKA